MATTSCTKWLHKASTGGAGVLYSSTSKCSSQEVKRTRFTRSYNLRKKVDWMCISSIKLIIVNKDAEQVPISAPGLETSRSRSATVLWGMIYYFLYAVPVVLTRVLIHSDVDILEYPLVYLNILHILQLGHGDLCRDMCEHTTSLKSRIAIFLLNKLHSPLDPDPDPGG